MISEVAVTVAQKPSLRNSGTWFSYWMQDQVGMARSQLLDGMIPVVSCFWSIVKRTVQWFLLATGVLGGIYNRRIGSIIPLHTTSIPGILYVALFWWLSDRKTPTCSFWFSFKTIQKCSRSEPENPLEKEVKKKYKTCVFGPKPWLVVVDKGWKTTQLYRDSTRPI